MVLTRAARARLLAWTGIGSALCLFVLVLAWAPLSPGGMREGLSLLLAALMAAPYALWPPLDPKPLRRGGREYRAYEVRFGPPPAPWSAEWPLRAYGMRWLAGLIWLCLCLLGVPALVEVAWAETAPGLGRSERAAFRIAAHGGAALYAAIFAAQCLRGAWALRRPPGPAGQGGKP